MTTIWYEATDHQIGCGELIEEYDNSILLQTSPGVYALIEKPRPAPDCGDPGCCSLNPEHPPEIEK